MDRRRVLMMRTLETWRPGMLVLIIFAVALLVLVDRTRRYIYDYLITGDAIEILLFRRFPIRRFLLSEITEIEAVSLRDLLASGELLVANGWANRLSSQVVRFRRAHGLTVLITPEDSERFVEEVRKRIAEINSATAQ
jgi:hypothetical protein